MADISREIQMFKEAIYGEAVRESMVSLAEKVNAEATASAVSATNSAVWAELSVSEANDAATRCGISVAFSEAQTDLAKEATKAAMTVAERVQEALNNGSFVGPPGSDGRDGQDGQKGEKGDQGDQGQQGEIGPVGPIYNTENPVFTGTFSQNALDGATIGDSAHVEGRTSSAEGDNAHAEGLGTQASGYCAHSQGRFTTASGNATHSQGSETTASGDYSHAEGEHTTASGQHTHAEGKSTTASGGYSHTEGFTTTASGLCSHARGDTTVASGQGSSAEGICTKATVRASHAMGQYNKNMTGTATQYSTNSDVLVIGNGTSNDSRSNAFRVTFGGAVYGKRAYTSSGADYAEFVGEWLDGNPDDEDRVGHFVTTEGEKIRLAEPNDYILGAISGAPSVIGGGDEEWMGRYEKDVFNRTIMEDEPELTPQLDEEGQMVIDEETNEPVMVETGNILPNARMKESPEYDPDKPYVERKDRKEWDYVGMLGVIPMNDDGTCQVGKFCKCGKGGIATLCEVRQLDSYMVLDRVNDHVVKIIMR